MRYSFLLIIFQALICFGCTRSSTSADANTKVVVERNGECVRERGRIRASYRIINKTINDISLFEVAEDGFGYDVEKLVDGNWRPSGVTWCGTGRKLIKVGPGKNYDFDITFDVTNVPVRVSVEYWEKEPLVTPAQMVSSKALLVQSCDER